MNFSFTIILLTFLQIVSADKTNILTNDAMCYQHAELFNTFYKTNELCLPKDNEQRYITCNPDKCYDFKNNNGIFWRFEDINGNVISRCVLRYYKLLEPSWHCVLNNGEIREGMYHEVTTAQYQLFNLLFRLFSFSLLIILLFITNWFFNIICRFIKSKFYHNHDD